MATHTTNLELNKQGYDDFADVVDSINNNLDIIDTWAGGVNESIRNINNKGAANAGKFLIVASNGDVVPTTVPFANGGTY